MNINRHSIHREHEENQKGTQMNTDEQGISRYRGKPDSLQPAADLYLPFVSFLYFMVHWPF